MSAALKQKPLTPTPFPTPERAALAHAIAAAADAVARRAALGQASQTANTAVLRAIEAAEAAETALAEAQGNTARHIVDKALGKAGAAPVTISQARAAVIQAQDALEEARAIRAALKAELEQSSPAFAQMRVTDAATAVIRAEVAASGAAMAARVSQLQKDLVAKGSALEWLAANGAFPTRNGRPVDDVIRNTVWRMESAPAQWATTTSPGEPPFAPPTGRLAWAAAFEALKRDATAALPED